VLALESVLRLSAVSPAAVLMAHPAMTIWNQPKPVEEKTDDELAAYIAAIDRYLSRQGVDPTSLEPPSGDPGGTRHTRH
jgi:hypothetical protein